MEWASIRNFLGIPAHLTGKGVAIAVVDGYFPPHPDITANDRRHTYFVNAVSADTKPLLFQTGKAPWKSCHGLMTSAAAAGSGSLSSGFFSGAAPEADLFLIETGPLPTVEETEKKFVMALRWLSNNWRKYNIRGVVLTIAYTIDTGLLPWQADPIKVHCEQLAKEGLLIVVASGNTKELTCSGPASSPSVLSVGGVIVPHCTDEISSYHGCHGITFEGKRIPEILAPAENIVLPTPFQSAEEYENHYTVQFDNLPDGYSRTEGTSYAAPVILGCAACIWQANPEWTASQVETAMIQTAKYKAEWFEAGAGLVDLQAASKYPGKSFTTADKFQRFDQSASVQSDIKIVSSILSSYGEAISAESIDQLKALIMHAQSPKVRAAALCRLAAASDLTYTEIRFSLNDQSSYVKMAALFCLRNREDMWEGVTSRVIDLFNDEDLNIQYCAIKLASTIKHPSFIKPLIYGMLNDARKLKVSTFGARCEALQRLTGIAYEPVPEFREGQCFYSELSTKSRIDIALKWQQYLAKGNVKSI